MLGLKIRYLMDTFLIWDIYLAIRDNRSNTWDFHGESENQAPERRGLNHQIRGLLGKAIQLYV